MLFPFPPSLPMQLYKNNDSELPVRSQPILVPTVLTISQLLRDINSARSRMTSMASTIQGRPSVATGIGVNGRLSVFNRFSTPRDVSTNQVQQFQLKSPSRRVTFPVQIAENPQNLELIDEERSLKDDELPSPTRSLPLP